jgi:hypothetical protein
MSASHPFSLKSRCKYCGSNKLEFYRDYSNPYWYPDTKFARNRVTAVVVKNWLRNLNEDYALRTLYQRLNMRYENTNSVAFKRYNPKLSRIHPGKNGFRYVSDMVVMVVCGNCHQQTWAYRNSDVAKLPENANRKARINCPQRAVPRKSEFW